MFSARTGIVRCAALGLLFAAGDCARPSQENFGLPGAPVEAVDVEHLTRPSELLKALALPSSEIDRRLGAHRLAAISTIKVEPAGQPAETLRETYRLETSGSGALHLVHDNDRGYGTEVELLEGQLYVRPRYGKFVRRRPEGDEVEQLRRGIEGVAAAYLRLLMPWMQLRESGRVDVAGHTAVRFKLSAAAPGAGAGEQDSDPAQHWRQSVRVRYINGELTLEAKSGAALNVELEASYTFERAGQAKPLLATLNFRQRTATGGVQITPPTDFVVAPSRPRPMLDRQQLLEGLGRR